MPLNIAMDEVFGWMHYVNAKGDAGKYQCLFGRGYGSIKKAGVQF